MQGIFRPLLSSVLPVRLTFDNNYFNALYQGIPVGGYTKMVANMLDGIEVQLGIRIILQNKEKLDATGREGCIHRSD